MAVVVTEVLAAQNGSSATSYTATFTASVSIGVTVIVTIASDTADALPATLTDSVGNSYTKSTAGSALSSTNKQVCQYYNVAIGSAIVSASTTITFATGSHSTNKAFKATAVTGVSAVSFDKSTTHSNASSTAQTTGSSGTLTQANELVFVAYVYDCSGGTPTFAVPTNYSQTATGQQVLNGAATAFSTCYRVVSATTTQNPSATLGAAQIGAGTIMTFEYTLAGSGTITPSSIAAGVTSVVGAISRGIVRLVAAEIDVTVAVSNRAPDILTSVSVFASVGVAPNVPITSGTITASASVTGAVSVFGRAGSGFRSRRTEGFAHVTGFPR